MSVQTRSQLVASAATITSETAAGANTAARVGGLFDDISDIAQLLNLCPKAALQLIQDIEPPI